MQAFLVLAIATGILTALGVIFGKKPITAHSPTAVEFKELVEERAKAFLSNQDLDSLVTLVPEENRAAFSAKFASFTQALVESSTTTGLSILLKIFCGVRRYVAFACRAGMKTHVTTAEAT